ncbi:MAG: mechanosensitive ion channel domain-containing protein [Haloarculaceae archaeon]
MLGAALGFGLRDLFAGVVGGLVIPTERPYQVGDHYGEVTNIGLRSTTLRTPDDNAVRVPDASLFTSNVSNANDGRPEMMAVVEVSIAPGADLDRATDVVEEAMVTSRYVFVDDDHPVAVRVEDENYYRTVRGKAYVADLRDEFAFTSDVTERSLAAFEEYGIETPGVPARFDGAVERPN